MSKPTSRVSKFVVIAVGCSIGLALVLIEIAFYKRDLRDLKSFHLVRRVDSPDGKTYAFIFEHTMAATPAYDAYYEEIVALDHAPSMSIGELMLRMKKGETVFRADTKSPRRPNASWLGDSNLSIECSGCVEPPIEILRRAESYSNISVRYVGMPDNAAYTDASPVEK